MRLRVVEVSTALLETPPSQGGAIESYVYKLSSAIARAGNDVHVIGVLNQSAGYDFHFHPIQLTSKRAHLLSRLWRGASLGSLVNGIIRDFGPIDVVHCHHSSSWMAALFFKHANSTLVQQWHHVPSSYESSFISKRFDLVLGISHFVEKYLRTKLHVPANRLGVLYNCASFGESPDGHGLETIKPEKRVLFVGRIVKEKGVVDLIHAFAKMRERLTKSRLVLVGPIGDFGDNTDASSRRSNLGLDNTDGGVTYLGSLTQDELNDLYRSSDLVVVPSLYEDPCPTVVLEAMSFSKPVVAYSSGGIPELVIDGETGYLVRKADVQELSNKMLAVLTDDVLSSRMGKAAFERLKAHFTPEIVAKQFLDLVRTQRSKQIS